MAGVDYWRCDVCGGKAFYDAPLNYDDDDHTRDDGVLLPLGCGDMAALCENCAKTHEVVVLIKSGRTMPPADAETRTRGGTARTESEMSDEWIGFDPTVAAFELDHLSERDQANVKAALAVVRRETAQQCAEIARDDAGAYPPGHGLACVAANRVAAAITKEFGPWK